jgi:hypothetical protein
LLNGSWSEAGEYENFVRFKEPWDTGGQGSQQYDYPLENGQFSYDLKLGNESSHFVGHRVSDGTLAFDHAEPMEELTLGDIQKVEFAVYSTLGNSNWLDNPTLTVCAEFPDGDEDGVRDALDQCPGSATTATVIIDGCDSGVENSIGENGCTVVDLVDQIAETAKNHGKFVSGVARLLNSYNENGTMTDDEKDSIQACAARANIP